MGSRLECGGCNVAGYRRPVDVGNPAAMPAGFPDGDGVVREQAETRYRPRRSPWRQTKSTGDADRTSTTCARVGTHRVTVSLGIGTAVCRRRCERRHATRMKTMTWKPSTGRVPASRHKYRQQMSPHYDMSSNGRRQSLRQTCTSPPQYSQPGTAALLLGRVSASSDARTSGMLPLPTTEVRTAVESTQPWRTDSKVHVTVHLCALFGIRTSSYLRTSARLDMP